MTTSPASQRCGFSYELKKRPICGVSDFQRGIGHRMLEEHLPSVELSIRVLGETKIKLSRCLFRGWGHANPATWSRPETLRRCPGGDPVNRPALQVD